MGICTGQQYIDSPNDSQQVYVDGKLVTDGSSHVFFNGTVQTLARTSSPVNESLKSEAADHFRNNKNTSSDRLAGR